jgi:hypothetical protein
MGRKIIQLTLIVPIQAACKNSSIDLLDPGPPRPFQDVCEKTIYIVQYMAPFSQTFIREH